MCHDFHVTNKRFKNKKPISNSINFWKDADLLSSFNLSKSITLSSFKNQTQKIEVQRDSKSSHLLFLLK